VGCGRGSPCSSCSRARETALALQLAGAAPAALYVTLELGEEDLQARILAKGTGILWPRILHGGDDRGPLRDDELADLHKARKNAPPNRGTP
jgi:hypothetical protein